MTSTDAAPPMTLTVPQVADHLNVSESKAWDLIGRGIIPSFTIGRRRLIVRRDLEQWIVAQTGVPEEVS